MKQSGRILILILTLAFLSAEGAYGIRGKFSRRKYCPAPRNYLRVPVRSVHDFPRAWRRKEYILPRQERMVLQNLEKRLPELLALPRRPLNLVRFCLRDFPTRREIDAVIFDLDGTLLDSLWAWENSGTNYLRSIGIEPAVDLQKKLETMSLMDGAKYIKEMYDLTDPPEVLLEKTLEPIKNRYLYEIKPMPGVREQLARLKTQGIKMAVATASHKEFAQAALERLGMLDYFDFIITCDEVGIGKTSPKVYEAALLRLGTLKERTLVVEDALHALETAHQAGFSTAAIDEKHSLADRVQKQQVADYYIMNYGTDGTLIRE